MILIRAPGGAPVYNPNEVKNPGGDEEIEESWFLRLYQNNNYDRMFILPKKIGEGKERKIVVSSLETGEAGYGNNGQKQFLDVLQHYILTNIIY